MKRAIIVFIGFVAAVSVLWFGVVNAANVRSGVSPTVMKDEVINGTLYAGGTNVKVEGTVQGDIMCAGQTVTITGTVEGDVLCVAQEITITGHVEGSVRIMAQTTSLGGKIDGSATVAGMVATVGDDALIAHDLTLLTQQATVSGTISRDVTAIVGNFTTNAAINRDLDVTGRTITLDDKAKVAGDFRYVSPSDAQLVGGAHITGITDHRVPEENTSTSMVSPASYISTAFSSLVSFLLLGLALLYGAPRVTKAVALQMKRSPFGTLGAGLLGLFVPPFVAVLLMVTMFGLPLGATLLFAWLVSLLLGLVFAALRIGELITGKMGWQESWQQFAALGIGLLVLFVLSLLPYFGLLILFSAVVWGIGGLWYAVIKNRTAVQTVKVQKDKS
jgi:hypothetical protein